MKFLVLALIVAFPLGQLDRFNLSQSEVVLHLNDIIVFLVVLIGLFLKRRVLIPQLRKNSLAKPILIWVGAMAISLIINSSRLTSRELLISSLYAFRWLSYAGLYFVFFDSDLKNKLFLKRGLILVTLIVAVIGLIQYIFLPDVSFLKAFDWDDHYFRLISTFLDPGFTGAILVLGLILAFSQLSKSFNHLITLIVLYLAMVLTYSRASYLMYVVSFSTIALYKRSIKIFLIAVIALALTIPLLPQHFGEGSKLTRENSIVARINNWKQSIAVWQKYPLLGVGFDAYRYSQKKTGANPITLQSHSGAGADSSLLLILATTGLLGLMAYLNLGRAIWQKHKNNSLIIASLGGILIHSFFNNTLFYPWVMEWFWLLLAMDEKT